MPSYQTIPQRWNCNTGKLEPEHFVVYYLTNKIDIPGVYYKDLNWDPAWKIFLNLYDKELKQKDFHDYTQNSIQHIICWFDHNIIQRIPYDTIITLEVRVRIICGMVNKLTVIPRELKILLMDCIWSTWRQFYYAYNEYYCRYILELPF